MADTPEDHSPTEETKPTVSEELVAPAEAEVKPADETEITATSTENENTDDDSKADAHPGITFNIFVGDLPPTITEQQLRDHFGQYGDIRLVNIIRDKNNGACKGYAFIHFGTREARDLALAPENSAPVIAGALARIKPSDEKTTLFVSNLPSNITGDELRTELLKMLKGIADDLKIELKMKDGVANHALATFTNFDAASNAKKTLMNAPLQDKQISVTWVESGGRQNNVAVVPNQPSRTLLTPESDASLRVTTLHISNIGPTATEEQLKALFSPYGEVTKNVIVKGPNGENRGFGFITLADREQCHGAMRELDRTEFAGQRIGVAFARAPSTGSGNGSAPPSERGSGKRGGGRGSDRGGDRGGRGGRNPRHGEHRTNPFEGRPSAAPHGQSPYGYGSPSGRGGHYPPSYGNAPYTGRGGAPAYPTYPAYGAPPAAGAWYPPAYPADPNAAYGAAPGAPAPGGYPAPYPYGDPNAAGYYGAGQQPRYY